MSIQVERFKIRLPWFRRMLLDSIALSVCLINIKVLILEVDELPNGDEEMDALTEDCKLDPDKSISRLAPVGQEASSG